MNLLELTREFALRTGQAQPSAVSASRDVRIQQYVGQANEVLDDLFDRKLWTKFRQEATFQTQGVDRSYNLAAYCGYGFQHLLTDTLYDRTAGQQILGPLSAQEWQRIKAGIFSTSVPHYRLDGTSLRITPVPPAEHLIAFEYCSAFAVQENQTDEHALKQYFTHDLDTCSYPDHLLLAGMVWMWRSAKGLRYAEKKQQYELAVARFAGNDGGAQPLNMSAPVNLRMGVCVPERNWTV